MPLQLGLGRSRQKDSSGSLCSHGTEERAVNAVGRPSGSKRVAHNRKELSKPCALISQRTNCWRHGKHVLLFDWLSSQMVATQPSIRAIFGDYLHITFADSSRSSEIHSELHGMRSVVLGQRESGAEVLLDGGVLDVGEESGVNGLLESLSGIGGGNLRRSIGEELLRLGGLLSLGLSEGSVVDLGHIDTLQVNLGRGGESVVLLNASDGNTVELEGTGDGEKAGLELLKEDDSLSSESTREQDKDGAGRDGLSELGSAGLVSVRSRLGIFSRVPLELLNHCAVCKDKIIKGACKVY